MIQLKAALSIDTNKINMISMITVTEKAKKYMQEVAPKYHYVTLGVKSGGCSGFEYIWGLSSDEGIEHVKWSDPIDNILLVDPIAEIYILGSEVDYVTELGGSYLDVKNPTSKSSCGCGASFGV